MPAAGCGARACRAHMCGLLAPASDEEDARRCTSPSRLAAGSGSRPSRARGSLRSARGRARAASVAARPGCTRAPTFSSLVSMARPGREEIVRQFYAGSGRGQGWRWGFLGWHSQCCSSQRRRKPRQRHSSPLLESSCPKPSPAGQARPATPIRTFAPKVRPFFSRPPPHKEDLIHVAPAAANISAGRQDRRFSEENPGGHVGVAGGDCRNEVVDASFLVPVPAARPT